MQKALVTGGAGFIGGHLVARLVQDGASVVIYDNLKRSSRAKLEPFEGSSNVRFVEGDIRDYAGLRAAARGTDVIYHLAAQSNVMGAIEDPDYSVTTNVLGTFNALRSAVDEHVGRVVFTSSREVYGEVDQVPVDESRPLAAKNPYGASKVAGEAYCRTFAHCHQLNVQVVRLANVYGAGDSGRVIPLWLAAAQEGRDLKVFGGAQIIDFLWVGTAVDALVHASRHDLPGPVNIGSGVGTSILELARRVIEVTRSKSVLKREPARDIEVAKFVADIGRMRALGLHPESDPLGHLAELVAAYPPGVAS
ncbi:MAG TPA: SDR family NAD(P)-dependent oxidoreductase [Polyangiaceae bacterium]|jgi:UDP-glucose 4-epimerase|nr:SDR family NAD(P)-dependent oxidoreductase [Polyangiaceae bacterium]